MLKKLLTVFVLMCLTAPISFLVFGYCFSQLFNWFVVPLGVPTIGVAHAYGLCTLVGYTFMGIHMKLDKLKHEPIETDMVTNFISTTVATWIASFVLLGFGYITQLFM